ncbi:hypothetical protein [Parvularcula maris]|uniref:Uncharacterized protein n=1 Tax=Parvularcula maris TaxID=2965077 RepID=A0A9X2L6P5_9PROT|nr:hypothetical protein [Parvularcula maris]MCQ8184129.1 hypothetical protein [Parvularcula maris]
MVESVNISLVLTLVAAFSFGFVTAYMARSLFTFRGTVIIQRWNNIREEITQELKEIDSATKEPGLSSEDLQRMQKRLDELHDALSRLEESPINRLSKNGVTLKDIVDG